MALRPQIGRQKIRLNLLGGVFNVVIAAAFATAHPSCQQLICRLAHLLTIDAVFYTVKHLICFYLFDALL
jgi:hypothetical protein